MKQQDIAVIIVVVVISGVISFFVSGKLFSTSGDGQQKVESVNAISSEFKIPDSTYFNKNSIDPTQLIRIGTSSNPAPFNTQQN